MLAHEQTELAPAHLLNDQSRRDWSCLVSGEVHRSFPGRKGIGHAVHSGEGAPTTVAKPVPLHVGNPAAYAREKQRAAQLAGAGAPLSAVGGLGSTPAPASSSVPAAVVFGSLNAAGLSAAQQIAAFGQDGAVCAWRAVARHERSPTPADGDPAQGGSAEFQPLPAAARRTSLLSRCSSVPLFSISSERRAHPVFSPLPAGERGWG